MNKTNSRVGAGRVLGGALMAFSSVALTGPPAGCDLQLVIDRDDDDFDWDDIWDEIEDELDDVL